MNRAHANAREDNTELERVVEELYEFDFYTDGGKLAVMKLNRGYVEVLNPTPKQ